MKKLKQSEIKFSVGTDENNVPESIEWFASAENTGGPSKAILLALWDEQQKNTLRIDLWTKEMTIDEMKQFFHQTLLTMTDTYERSTGDNKLAEDMRDFCAYFGMKTGLIKEGEV